MDSRGDDAVALDGRIGTVLDYVGALRAGPRVSSDARFSPQFMREHTQFDSFDAFREASPWSLDARSLRDVPEDPLDDYVDDVTEFETFEEMRTLAATEELVDQAIA